MVASFNSFGIILSFTLPTVAKVDSRSLPPVAPRSNLAVYNPLATTLYCILELWYRGTLRVKIVASLFKNSIFLTQQLKLV